MKYLDTNQTQSLANKIFAKVKGLLDNKANKSHTHTISQITDFPTIPTKTSQLTNDSGFLTSHQSLSDYVKKKNNNDANGLLNSLSVGTSIPVDDDYYISQYVNGGNNTTTYHRRKVSALWSYIKSKIDAAGYKTTDTNTWRPVQDNLTSTSTTDALSANQGRILKAAVDAKAAKGDKGDTGAQGPTGPQGPAGANGNSHITYISARTVAPSAFVTDPTNTHPFRATVTISGITSNDYAMINVEADLADAYALAMDNDTYNGGIYIYSETKPASNVEIISGIAIRAS